MHGCCVLNNKKKAQEEVTIEIHNILEKKVEAANKDIRGAKWFKKTLLDNSLITAKNANCICDYDIAMRQESNISVSTRRNILVTLIIFAKKVGISRIDFENIDTRSIKSYLAMFQKSE